MDRQNRHRSVESEEEEAYFNSASTGFEKSFFRFLHPKNPYRARKRVSRIYWEAWGTFRLSFFLAGLGVLLLCIGGGCVNYCEEPSRGFVLLLAAVIVLLPGWYSMYAYYCYVRCYKGSTLLNFA
ncbi:hypothetical protein AGDE_01600 [Angomonas deanei]|uniref:Transmembrane protein 230 n=1 Tax=Angomonas deanei TaxID=59799 RepID=A0A7G2CDR8_9TRYP|nr:hypothetical protein AGDE_01600 [Angomonas deanei]CAD2217990.1 Eukaryotic protein of unknown function (DUF872), putative [Angomonas deanei]|eukprot:EPY42323.1 hypothetical protein AGDE_01600 [Angomonas deanei]